MIIKLSSVVKRDTNIPRRGMEVREKKKKKTLPKLKHEMDA